MYKIVNKCYHKLKERLLKDAREKYQNFSEEEKDKEQKMLEKDMKVLLKKKKEDINIIRKTSNVTIELL